MHHMTIEAWAVRGSANEMNTEGRNKSVAHFNSTLPAKSDGEPSPFAVSKAEKAFAEI